jgi:hypothetical protein
MTKRQTREENRPTASDPRAVIDDLLKARSAISSGDVARSAGVTRQAAYYHLSRMVRSGELIRTGVKRGTRYRRATLFAKQYELDHLEEHLVWGEVDDAVSALTAARPNVRSILQYAFTEMLNNAIEHSEGTRSWVRVWKRGATFAFLVSDDGVGVFRKVRNEFALPDEYSAIQHLAKGKQTTQPERHTGEGIFFTSKAVDLFQLESRGLKWIVDNRRADHAIGDAPFEEGTRVQWELDEDSDRELSALFDGYTDEQKMRFRSSSVRVKLGERNAAFVSRSEAKRLTLGLDAFDEVVLDFTGVSEVGQGFVDELFRVWAREHPKTKLIPENVSPNVSRFLERGIAGTEGGDRRG